jgi:hypothetical protein
MQNSQQFAAIGPMRPPDKFRRLTLFFAAARSSEGLFGRLGPTRWLNPVQPTELYCDAAIPLGIVRVLIYIHKLPLPSLKSIKMRFGLCFSLDILCIAH